MKIKIISKEKEYEGSVEEKVATPFGNSAHINVGRKHSGKYLSVIIPSKPEYSWVLSEADLSLVVKECREILKNDNGELKHYKQEALKNVQSKRFSLNDLEWVLKILKNKPLIKKIKFVYSL